MSCTYISSRGALGSEPDRANANRRRVSTTLSMAPAIEATTGKDVATKTVATTIAP
jgi:hypothetical protein